MAKISVCNCQTCGGALNYSEDGLSAVCPFCGNQYKFKNTKTEALALALNRANLLRINCDFDGAICEYKLILNSDGQDAEANWGMLLSIYGIEYVEDARTKKLIPTCRRTVSGSIFDNPYYIAAVTNAEKEQAQTYSSQAKIIDRLQRDIARRMAEEENFDVFICYRSSDENGYPTRERVVARRIYDELNRRGIKTFYSEVTLKDRLGDDYEPIIFKALYSCKFFVLVAFSEENIQTPWVKNEWTRFRDRAAAEQITGACCAVFDNASAPYLPAFVRSQQGINIAKYPAGGYEIELADNLSRKFSRYEKPPVESRTYLNVSADLRTMLEAAQIYLEDEDYTEAEKKYQSITSIYPKCGEAWWGAFLADHKAYSAALAAQKTEYAVAIKLSSDKNLRNAERYGDEATRAEITKYKKMCIYRCGELAAACDDNIEKINNELEQKRSRFNEIGVLKKKAADERAKKAKTADTASYKTRQRVFVICLVFVIIFFIFMGALIDDMLPFFGVMVFIMIVMLVFVMIMQNVNYKKARRTVDELGEQVSAYYSEEQRLIAEIEGLDRELDDEKRMAQTYRSVFR